MKKRITAISHFTDQVSTYQQVSWPLLPLLQRGREVSSRPKLAERGGGNRLKFLSRPHLTVSQVSSKRSLTPPQYLASQTGNFRPCGLVPLITEALSKSRQARLQEGANRQIQYKIFINDSCLTRASLGLLRSGGKDGTDSHLGSQIILDSWGKE